jgi:hypothetical protein
MKKKLTSVGSGAIGVLAVTLFVPIRAAAQDPILTPIIVSEVAPIVVKALTPKPKPGQLKFEGYVMNANSTQITVKAKGNDMAIQTFALSAPVSTKMQQIIDQGGYQYGDKITVYYDTTTHQALRIKGKPSRPL